jgi:hypothetical protein
VGSSHKLTKYEPANNRFTESKFVVNCFGIDAIGVIQSNEDDY